GRWRPLRGVPDCCSDATFFSGEESFPLSCPLSKVSSFFLLVSMRSEHLFRIRTPVHFECKKWPLCTTDGNTRCPGGYKRLSSRWKRRAFISNRASAPGCATVTVGRSESAR